MSQKSFSKSNFLRRRLFVVLDTFYIKVSGGFIKKLSQFLIINLNQFVFTMYLISQCMFLLALTNLTLIQRNRVQTF